MDVLQVTEWSTSDVSRYLKTCNWIDAELVDKFAEHEMDGAAMMEVTKEDLREDFNVKELGKVKRILRGISRTGLQYAPPTPAPPTPQNIECDTPISQKDLNNTVIPPHPPERVERKKKRPATASGDSRIPSTGSPTLPVRPRAATAMGYSSGILESERRYAEFCNIYTSWVSGLNITEGGIATQTVFTTLDTYLSWSKQDHDEVARLSPTNNIDMNGFIRVMTYVTEGMTPCEFDSLAVYLVMCVKRTADMQELNRREKLAKQLFMKWDHDGSGSLSQDEFDRVLETFNKVASELDNGNGVALSAHDADGDGELDVDEFTRLLTTVWKGTDPKRFDLNYFRLSRVVADVVLMQLIGAPQLRSEDILSITTVISPLTPVLLYGTGFDPSRAVEEAAEAASLPLHPILVTHRSAEREAISAVVRPGMGRGYWIYVIIGSKYNADGLLRELGIRLQTTHSWLIHSKFRLFIFIPFRSTVSLPPILTMHSMQVNIDNPNIQQTLAKLPPP
eukprot:TRINITY_DN3327_c0_g2_i1.p1 TRINITY_DN3327_c0_g2~~TRINITY_DN3327_c0_g2_i1.p1  ORF type:complete len:507 (+),score=122.48 TRINITY_DN3327_c0_g2_i1:57-1577(+)